MKNQIKFYLALLAVILLQGSIFSISLKESESLKLNLETETKTEHRYDDTLTADEQQACEDEIPKSAEVSCDNPGGITTPQDPNERRPELQNKVHVWSVMDQCLKKFNDVGVNSEGAIGGVGTNGQLYVYDYDMDVFEIVHGDIDLQNLRRMDIGYDGRIYVINYSGDTYYLTCNRQWIKLPGCAIDIGTGRGHEVVKIGCDNVCQTTNNSSVCNIDNTGNVTCPTESNSPYVYKLVCDCDCRCCSRRCNIFVKFSLTLCEQCLKDNDRKCYWIKYPNGPCYEDTTTTPSTFHLCRFSRIDAHMSGDGIVIGECDTGDYGLWQFVQQSKNVFKRILTQSFPLRDVCGDNYGNIFYIAETATSPTLPQVFLFRPLQANLQITHAELISAGTEPGWNISCGPYAQPTITDKDCCMWTTTKHGYN